MYPPDSHLWGLHLESLKDKMLLKLRTMQRTYKRIMLDMTWKDSKMDTQVNQSGRQL